MRALRLHRELDAIWSAPPGWRGTISSVNHTDIGRRFILAAFAFFAIGGVLAMLIRAQLATPDSAFVGPEVYNQLFTMHGSIMMFLFAIPMFEGLAMYLLPKMLGSRDMAFPRLSAFGWWCYLFGGIVVVASLLFGVAPDGGWFMYVPLAGKTYTPGINADIWLLGITFVEISAMCAAIEILVSILKIRAPGMALDRMPLFAWYMLATAGMMLFGFPPLILGSILLEMERAFGWPFFEVAKGGDPLLWQHLFWLFGHPEVYIIFLPAAGAVSTILPVMARTRILGYGWLVAAVMALAFLSFGLWVHHMFTTGIPHMALAFFSAASTLVAIPTGVQVFAWLGTLWHGRPMRRLPMLYLIGFFVVFVAGGLTGVMLAVVPFDWQAHDTAFVTAHLHYVLVGGFVFPMLAAAYYWLPHFTGHARTLHLGETAFWLIFVGFNLTFLMMHLTGLLGMPRRIESYSAEMGWTWLNLLSSVGSFVMAFGFALFAIDVGMQIFLGRRARRNPWGAATLEWAMPIPAPTYNFASQPDVSGRDPLADDPALALRLARGEGWLAHARNGWRETMAVDMLSGRAEQIVVLPGNSRLPILTAGATGAFFLSMLAGLYWIAPLFILVVAGMAWRWGWVRGVRTDIGDVEARDGTSLPTHFEAAGSPGWWGSVFAIAADATLFASALFGYAFLWTIAPNWPPPRIIEAAWLEPLVAGTGAIVAAAAVRAALSLVRSDGPGRARAAVLAAAGMQACSAAALVALAVFRAPSPFDHAYGAIVAFLLSFAALHAVIAAIVAMFGWARIGAGFVSARRANDLRIAMLWSDHASGVTLVTLAVVVLPGWLA